ncbi:MAG: selenide, water dikinase SelD [Gemmatimonadaceae bacterium]|nr:selenide, water dikinase SelD [Gemmatimonadaceae bacterium]NUS96866.1 selenide, water dikinase SelD [Gemmatimonadaceae bacterium]
MGPGDLTRALAPLARRDNPRLLVGHETFDDAGIVRLSDDLALVQTVDFFAPIVDDPYDFGRVAAANALSDVYAMGGEPITALNVAAFPSGKLPIEVLGEILRGGQDVVHAAGALVVGGHTVTDDELKFGLAVTGRVHPDRILTNAAAAPGDVLVLTKPIGTGILATAGKNGKLSAGHLASLVSSMTTLNAVASRVAVHLGLRCATDVTGFGLLGHLSHIARASGVAIRLDLSAIPWLPGTREAWEGGARTGGGERNRDFVEGMVDWGSASDFERAALIDPQTSGGLLVAVPSALAADYLSRVPGAVAVGLIVERGAPRIVLA